MGFGRERAEGHRAADEVLHDGFDRFDFLNRDGGRGLEAEESAQRAAAVRLVVDLVRVGLELRIVVAADGETEVAERGRRPEVVLRALAVAVESAGREKR